MAPCCVSPRDMEDRQDGDADCIELQDPEVSPPAHTERRTSWTLLGICALGIGAMLFFFTYLFTRAKGGGSTVRMGLWQSQYLNLPSAAECEAHSRYLSSEPHSAGHDRLQAQAHLFHKSYPNPTPTPPDTGLSKHGDPVFPHFWAFFGTIVCVVLIHWRMWFAALCRLQEGSIWVSKCWRSCNSMCSWVWMCIVMF